MTGKDEPYHDKAVRGLRDALHMWRRSGLSRDNLPQDILDMIDNMTSSVIAWRCRACDCLWRDNHDGSVSLFNTRQRSCQACEDVTTRATCDHIDEHCPAGYMCWCGELHTGEAAPGEPE